MTAVGLTTWIWENQFKTMFLVFLFPVSVFVVIFIALYLYFSFDTSLQIALEQSSFDVTLSYFIDILTIGVPVFSIWFVLSILFHRRIVFSLSNAVPVTRKTHSELYNIVENLCISRGLPIPEIALMPESGMNAFATGWSPKKSWIVFSQGLVDSLNKKEIEAVAAHELTHIINRDVRLMTLLVVFIGIISVVSSILLRMHFFGGGNNKKEDGRLQLVLFLLGIVLYLFSLIVLPLMRLAVSRKREFLADAGAVELTHDAEALVSALQKISGNSQLKVFEGKATMSAMCIEEAVVQKKKKKTSWFSSHPSIDDRIRALRGSDSVF